MHLTDVFGWTGSILILSAYILVSKGKVNGKNTEYQIMNFFGATGLAVNACAKEAWPIFILELAWVSIAVFSIAVMTKKYKTTPQS